MNDVICTLVHIAPDATLRTILRKLLVNYATEFNTSSDYIYIYIYIYIYLYASFDIVPLYVML